MSEGFMLDANTAMVFYRFCARYHINDREGRTLVLREICRRGKAKYLRDVEAAVEGKNVLRVKRSQTNEN